MARFQFKLPDIGEGIAEAEIVAWHVKVGDRVEEDQQLADMMTDKATVEMESPVAGKVVELAGEVGDQIPIGSVLAVIETDAAGAPAEEEVPLADGASEATPAQEDALPTTAVEETPLPPAGGEEPRSGEGEGVSRSPAKAETVPPPAPPASGRGARQASPIPRR
jgi:2-oxoisovalerate dehydrogenase E2 component (dihydrolipoyl transacylase)